MYFRIFRSGCFGTLFDAKHRLQLLVTVSKGFSPYFKDIISDEYPDMDHPKKNPDPTLIVVRGKFVGIFLQIIFAALGPTENCK